MRRKPSLVGGWGADGLSECLIINDSRNYNSIILVILPKFVLSLHVYSDVCAIPIHVYSDVLMCIPMSYMCIIVLHVYSDVCIPMSYMCIPMSYMCIPMSYMCIPM